MKKRIIRALGVLLLFALMLAEIEHYEYIESNKKIVYQSQDDLWQTGRLEYKGELYQYNENVKTYLIMGIDKPANKKQVLFSKTFLLKKSITNKPAFFIRF